MKYINALFVCFFIFTVTTAHAESSSRPVTSYLTQTTAEERAKQISDVSYQLSLSIDDIKPNFHGNVIIKFNLKPTTPTSQLTVDFTDGQVLKLVINGVPQNTINYNKYFITLPSTALHSGNNEIVVDFNHPYSRDGLGLYRFKDPQDGKTYLYSQFESYYANKMFPCFDQPDLKATYQLTVNAPSSWTIISSVREQKITATQDNTRTWYFPETQRFSTYVFSLHAGPYFMWQSQAGKIPLRLFARASLAKDVDANEWFKITQQGMKFYQHYFNYPYPFQKYDQILVPDFNMGAMENVGAVTFNEDNIRKTNIKLLPMHLHRGEVILHELAHMWFGNLVTLRFWNDLWLNESFATYMSMLALQNNPEFNNAWLYFYNVEKLRAYFLDRSVVTHPIWAKITNTEESESNFDEITYQKGASVLKQLAFYLGADQFRAGVREYIAHYAFQNTTLTNFLSSLSHASKIDLSAFENMWLKTTGFNAITAKYSCQNGKITAFSLQQTHEPLRAHRTQITLYNFNNNNQLVANKTLAVRYQAANQSITNFVGLTCPVFINLNEGDMDYAQSMLDVHAIAATKLMNKISDPLTRAMLWQGLWEQVESGQLPLQNYDDLIFTQLAQEKNLLILRKLFNDLQQSRLYLNGQNPVLQKILQHNVTLLENGIWQQMQSATAGSELQNAWLNSFIRFATTSTAQNELIDLLTGKINLPGLTLNNQQRWDILIRLSRLDNANTKKLLAIELQRDPSHLAKLNALAVDASRPDIQNKQKWFTELTKTPSSLTLAEADMVMKNMFPDEQVMLQKQFSTAFYQGLEKLMPQQSETFLQSYVTNLVPTLCTEKSVAKLDNYLKHNKIQSPAVLKGLRFALENDQRCIMIRNKAIDQNNPTKNNAHTPTN